jgi:hypothetical protein
VSEGDKIKVIFYIHFYMHDGSKSQICDMENKIIPLEILHTHLVFIFLISLVYVEGTPWSEIFSPRCLRYSPLDEGATSSSVITQLYFS